MQLNCGIDDSVAILDEDVGHRNTGRHGDRLNQHRIRKGVQL